MSVYPHYPDKVTLKRNAIKRVYSGFSCRLDDRKLVQQFMF